MNKEIAKIPQTADRRPQTALLRLKSIVKKYAIVYYPARFILKVLVFLRWQFYKLTAKFNSNGLNTTESRPRKIIASLTSYPARIKIVPYVITSLLNQTMKPDKIILWLGKKQFPDEKLPPVFDKLKACGVEVKFREDIRAHTKYFYAVKENPEDIVITFDDDIIYMKHIIADLYRSYIEHPECVSSMRVHKITFQPDGTISPYTEWDMQYSGALGKVSHIWLATGVGGVLYPPHCLSYEVFNVEAMKKLSFMNDDIWLKFMEVMNGTKVVPASDNGRLQGFVIPDSQEFALWKSNVSARGNDDQIQALLKAYSDWRDPTGKTLLEVIRDN